MTENFVEDLVAEYYRIKGYFVMKNYWFPFITTRKRTQKGKEQSYNATSWSDIDVIAMNETELLLVQVKAVINKRDMVKDITRFFSRAEGFLNKGYGPDDKKTIHWFSKNRRIRRIVVYEWEWGPRSYIEAIRKHGIEAIPFNLFFEELKTYIKGREGVKEEKSLLRFLYFLEEHGYFHENKKE